MHRNEPQDQTTNYLRMMIAGSQLDFLWRRQKWKRADCYMLIVVSLDQFLQYNPRVQYLAINMRFCCGLKNFLNSNELVSLQQFYAQSAGVIIEI